MRYTILCDPYASIFAISVFPSNYGGAVPIRTYPVASEFMAALSRLGLTHEAQADATRDVKKRQAYVAHNIELDDWIAHEFGWPPE